MSQTSQSGATGLSSRGLTTLLAFALGTPAGVGILLFIGQLGNPEYERYIVHPVEKVTVIMFCCALAALLTKLLLAMNEKRAFRNEILPHWDGQPAPVEEAGQLRIELLNLGRALRGTYLVRRALGVLEFVNGRGSAEELDDQLRTLADNDAAALEGSYSLMRLIIWAIPILGFLGTVLGISKSISGVKPEDLESISTVTAGLAEAFDTTALALALTMIAMLCSFLVERVEQGVLEQVDRFADEQLAHRFERTGSEGAVVVQVVSQTSKTLIRATEQLVEKQAVVWAKSLEAAEKQWAETGQRHQERLTLALETALKRTLEGQAQRVAGLEGQFLARTSELIERLTKLTAALGDGGRDQQVVLNKNLQHLSKVTEALGHLHGESEQLGRTQQLLAQNLAVVTNTGAFEEALHSLTAAIHLLTSRAGAAPSAGSRLGAKPGTAA